MNKFIILLILSVILIKYYSFPHPTEEYKSWFEIPNVILVYDVDDLTEKEIKNRIVHEFSHFLCFKLWKVHPQDHNRCFTKGTHLID